MDAGALLRDARRRANLSRRELARRAGTSQATLSAYEHGRVSPSIAVLSRILNAAGFTVHAELISTVELEQTRVLEELLELAEQYPWRDPGQLNFPILARARP